MALTTSTPREIQGPALNTDTHAEEPVAASLAYENSAFLDSSDGRAIRILSEYQEPLARLRRARIQDTIVFFGSARFHALGGNAELELAALPYARQPAPEEEQPARTAQDAAASKLRATRAAAAVRMARYYEDARKLASLLSEWAQTIHCPRSRFVITSGGGPGIMEAANRGAAEAGGKTIGFNIRLPFEQAPNRYITPGLNFDFHYFFMRKFWFAYLAKALVVFPGGFGTLDEMFECITLAQTHKFTKPLVIVVYGSEYWKGLVNFQQLVDDGAISPEDMELFRFVDTPEQAFTYLRDELTHRFLEPHPQTDPQSGETSQAVPEFRPEDNPDRYFGPELSKTNC